MYVELYWILCSSGHNLRMCLFSLSQSQAPLNDEITQWVLESLRERESRIQSIKGTFSGFCFWVVSPSYKPRSQWGAVLSASLLGSA